MKITLIKILSSIFFAVLLLYYFAYFALLMTIASLCLTEFFLTEQSELLASGENPLLFIQKLFEAVLNNIPFEELFASFLDYSAPFLGGICTILKGVFTSNPKALFEAYANNIPRDIAVFSLSGLLSYILTRITYIFKRFGKILVSLACSLLNPMWLLASYSASVCFFTFLEMKLSIRSVYAYIVITVAAYTIHSLLLGYTKTVENQSFITSFLILGFDIGFNFIRAVIMFILCTCLPGLYSPLTVMDSMGAIVTVTILFYILEVLERNLLPSTVNFIKNLFCKKRI